MLKKDLKTSLRDVKTAVTREKLRELKENSTMQFALNAARNAKFLLSQKKTDLFIAASALQTKSKIL